MYALSGVDPRHLVVLATLSVENVERDLLIQTGSDNSSGRQGA
jgi:hypothetical protein